MNAQVLKKSGLWPMNSIKRSWWKASRSVVNPNMKRIIRAKMYIPTDNDNPHIQVLLKMTSNALKK